VDNEVMW